MVPNVFCEILFFWWGGGGCLGFYGGNRKEKEGEGRGRKGKEGVFFARDADTDIMDWRWIARILTRNEGK